MDFASLGIKIDSSQAKTGASDLDRLTVAGAKSEKELGRLNDTSGKLSGGFGALKVAIGALGLGVLAREFVQAADAMALMDARLKIATSTALEFSRAQGDIYRIAQANNVGLRETAQLYTKLADPIKALGGGTQEVAAIVDAFATSMRVGGASAQEASSATLQFAQAMASGKLSGDEFRSMAEASPRFMKALAEGLNVPTGKLKEMSTEGKLTADVVGNALIKSLGKLKEEAKNIPDTVGGAMTRLKNDISVAINDINSSSGLTLGLAGVAEEVRLLIPTIKTELSSAFQSVQGWIDANKDGIRDIYETAKAFVSETYELGKAFASVLGALVELGIQSGAFKATIESVRILIAGLTDGVTFLGGVFASIGGIILKAMLTPIRLVIEGIASLQSAIGNEGLASTLRQTAANIGNFAGAGGKYGDSIVDSFSRGDSAIGKLNASLENASKTALKAKNAVKSTYDGYSTGGTTGFTTLKGEAEKKDGKGAAAKISEYTRMSEAISKVNAQTQQELDNGSKLSASEKFRLDEIQKITFALKTKKISQAESIELLKQTGTATEKLAQIEKNAASVKAAQFNFAEQEKFKEEVRLSEVALSKAREQGLLAVTEYSKAIDTENTYTLFQLSLAGQTEAAREKEIEYYKIKLDLQKQLDAIDKNEGFDNATKLEQKAKAEAAAATARAGVTSKSQLQATGFAANFAQSLKDPKQLEIERNAENTKKLNEAIFQNEVDRNTLIEEERKRHLQALFDMQSANDIQSLSQIQSVGDQIYSLLKQSGKEQTALGKAVFLANKAIAVAEIIINTEVAAAKAGAQAGIFGIPMASIIRATGYASAGIVAGTAIAQVSGGKASGGSVDSGGMYRVNERGPEMLSVKGQDFLMMGDQSGVVTPNSKLNGGNGGITIVNNTSAKIGKVVEQRMPSGERALIIQEAVETMAGQFSDPNSRASRGISRNYAVQRNR
jgi:tape measure domain-containing protein